MSFISRRRDLFGKHGLDAFWIPQLFFPRRISPFADSCASTLCLGLINASSGALARRLGLTAHDAQRDGRLDVPHAVDGGGHGANDPLPDLWMLCLKSKQAQPHTTGVVPLHNLTNIPAFV